MRLRRAFGVVSADVIRDPALSASAKTLYALLCTYADEDGVCYPSNEKLSEEFGCSVSTVQRGLVELTDAHVLARQERFVEGRQVNSVTRLTDAVTTRIVTDEPPGGSTSDLQNKTSSNKKELAKKPPASERARRSAQPLIGAWVDGWVENRTDTLTETGKRRFSGNARDLANELRRQHGTLTDVPDAEWQRALDTARHLGANGWTNLVGQFYGEDGRPPTLPVDGSYRLYDDGTFATW